ncbi:FmdB family zinc ribbon protein [Curtobacterium pusillum]|uniref:FmdB family zinc ribbon protein n=1 Tax=Curtobacterium pusillum TaxID=69373 RepID=UPI0011A5C684|nr:FmdB family zinc ribbon protein [Curtobacterium pusillum]
MPTYSYRCTECDNAFDIKQSFTDATLTECPVCGGVLRKVFSPVGVTFNGGGFYRTDSRAAPKGEGSGGSSSGGSSSGGSASSGSSGDSSSSSSSAPAKTESKPAAAKPAAS